MFPDLDGRVQVLETEVDRLEFELSLGQESQQIRVEILYVYIRLI